MTGKSRRAAIVGAGLGGLSAAIRLAARGWEVEVFDQQEGPGGKAFSRWIAGAAGRRYRFDTGPSLLTMTGVFEQLFAEVGETLQQWLRPIRLPIICRYVFADGTVVNAWADTRRFAEEIGSRTSDSPQAVLRYLEHCRSIYERAGSLFLWRSLHEPSTYLDRRALATLLSPGRLDALRTMHQANRAFFRDPRTVQLFDRYATYNGSSPFRAPATLNIIPWVEYGLGGYAVEGGIYSIPLALAGLAEKIGVRFHYGARVERILTARRRVTGVSVRRPGCAHADNHESDIVVSNADVQATYDMLGDPEARLARRTRGLEPSSSALVFLWGVRGPFDELEVNNIFFSPDYEAEFRDLFERRICPSDPTVYVNVTSRVTAGDAPAGSGNWFVLVNAPAARGQDWQRERDRVRAAALRRVTAALARPVDGDIECEEVATPADIERTTGSRGGSLYGIASNSRAAAFLRHPNRSRRHRGLYVCGGSAHPGGGMPLAVLSGRITSELVRRHEGL